MRVKNQLVKNQLVKVKSLISKRNKWPSIKVRRKKMMEKKLMEQLLINKKKGVSQLKPHLIKKEKRVRSKKRNFSNRLRPRSKEKNSPLMFI